MDYWSIKRAKAVVNSWHKLKMTHVWQICNNIKNTIISKLDMAIPWQCNQSYFETVLSKSFRGSPTTECSSYKRFRSKRESWAWSFAIFKELSPIISLVHFVGVTSSNLLYQPAKLQLSAGNMDISFNCSQIMRISEILRCTSVFENRSVRTWGR